jgi:hypothetical protein
MTDEEEAKRFLAKAEKYKEPAVAYLYEVTGHAVGDPDAPDTRFGEVNSPVAAGIVAMRNSWARVLDVVARADAYETAYHDQCPRCDGDDDSRECNCEDRREEVIKTRDALWDALSRLGSEEP